MSGPVDTTRALQDLAKLTPSARESQLTDLVMTQARACGRPGMPTPKVGRNATFAAAGIDSVGLITLHARLVAATGLALPVSVGFDHPTPRALGKHLAEEAFGESGSAGRAIARGGDARAPIAVVGMACRLPGGIRTADDLWAVLAEERCVRAEFPRDRGWELERIAAEVGASHGYFVEDIAGFDAEFWGISRREALAMDPQQRLLLEGAWEALEEADLDPASLKGSRTGVFIGAGAAEYGPRTPHMPQAVAGYALTGAAMSVASGRVAYQLGLSGPTMTVDTACSGSLVAMHLAVQSLRAGECNLALAGGATILSAPSLFDEFTRQGGLAPDGRIKPFSADADGTAFGEGMAMLVLERLDDAVAAGHRVLAVIEGSAINSDGASNGLTAPNGTAQVGVIRDALADAGLSVEDVDVIEAHGTGTRLGDPIEAHALLGTYGRRTGEPVRLGSVKSNIGHTQAAAGIASVIKLILALRHETLPRTVNIAAPTTGVDWSAGSIDLATSATTWARGGQRKRRAGVSSFGISGTNAHIVLSGPEVPAQAAAEAPTDARESDAGESDAGESDAGESGASGSRAEAGDAGGVAAYGVVPLVVSGHSPQAVTARAGQLLALAGDGIDPLTLARTVGGRRATHRFRHALLATDTAGLTAQLERLAAGEPAKISGEVADPRIAFVYTGQGSQRVHMARDLARRYPIVGETLSEVVAHADIQLPQSLWDLLWPATADGAATALLRRPEYAAPAIFAVEVALTRLLESFGIRPDVVLGHSVGEYAAAHAAGILSLADAAMLVTARGRLMAHLPEGGAMLAIEATAEEARELLEETLDPACAIGAVNGPRSVVLSGPAAAIERAATLCTEKSLRHKRLAVGHAYHSPLMRPILDEFGRVAALADHAAPAVAMISSVTGAEVETLDAGYWVAQVEATVRFDDALVALGQTGANVTLELGPDAVLTPLVAARGAAEDYQAACLRAGRDEVAEVTRAVLGAHVRGVDLDWAGLLPGVDGEPVALPPYPFQRRRYWIDPDTAAERSAERGLMSAVVPVAGSGGVVLTGRVSTSLHPWLADHVVEGVALMPGTGWVEIALQAGRACGAEQLSELTMELPLTIEPGDEVLVQVVVGGPDERGGRSIECWSTPAAGEPDWRRHASGFLGTEADSAAPVLTGEAWPPAGADEIDVSTRYADIFADGYNYGPAFQGLRRAWVRRGEVDEFFAEVALPDDVAEKAERYGVHPALLDAVLHGADEVIATSADAVMVPFTWHEVRLADEVGPAVRVRIVGAGEDALAIELATADGRPAGAVGRLALRPLTADALRNSRPRPSLQAIAWEDIATPEAPAPGGPVCRIGHPASAADSAAAESAASAAAAESAADSAAASAAGAGAPLAALGQALEAVQAHLSGAPGERLAVVTTGASEVTGAAGLAHAPVWGLVRSAQAENPGALQLIDTDGTPESEALLDAARALAEPEVRIRAGKLQVSRLVETTAPVAGPAPERSAQNDGTAQEDAEAISAPAWPADEVVLVTGGTGGVGQALIRHLAGLGARHIVAASRRGPQASGAAELVADLAADGVTLRPVACDLAVPGAADALVAEISAGARLGSVIHAAGVLDDALVTSLTPERIDSVFAPKATAAWALHEATRALDLRRFVLFSSVSGLLDGAGQGNYAAANVYCDELANYRTSLGLPATSIAWGLWAGDAGMGAGLDAATLQRMAVLGIRATSFADNLRFFDEALTRPGGAHVALTLDKAALRRRADDLPALLARLAPRTVATTPAPVSAVAGSTPEELLESLTTLVRTEAAAVLGYDGPHEVGLDRAFSETGFDSLGAIELRNRLQKASGVPLSATLTFDFPTPRELAGHLSAQLAAVVTATTAPMATAPTASKDDPIAIIGMACRLPGGVDSPDALWRLVEDGVDAIGAFPTDRGWDPDLLDPAGAPGTTISDRGGFLYDAAWFDPDFFGISPREASAMDPQQRILIETVWHSLEHAGLNPTALRGSSTGVFAGTMYHDWGLRGGPLPEEFAGYHGNGSIASMMSGRISYLYGFQGPSMSIDTACSSSLVAMHLAGEALRRGECDLALAGGVTVMSTPDTFVDMSRQGGLAADGRCKSYGDGADGTGWGEGVGVLVLERLSDARRKGHRVFGIVAGTAVNSDGASNGLTAPNGPAQQRVIAAALADAGVTTAEVDLVEGHGTGTTLGDPIEAQAVLATYGQNRTEPVRLGSIKSNIGHAQAAAGVAGVIKVVQAIRHRVLPRSLHGEHPSSHVDWSAGAVELLTDNLPWPGERTRRAGVSSFGISGTNAHVVIEEAPADIAALLPIPYADAPTTGAPSADAPAPAPAAAAPALPVALPVSGRAPGAVSDAARALAAQIPAVGLAPLAAELAGRATHEHRAVAWAGTDDAAMTALTALADGTGGPATVTGSAPAEPVTAWLFTGQGSQWHGMGARLRSLGGVFAATVDDLIGQIPAALAWLATAAGLPDIADSPVAGQVDRLLSAAHTDLPEDLDTGLTQCALYVYETALAAQLTAWGMTPDIVVGHSIGESAAAVTAGVLSATDGLRLVLARGWLMGRCGGTGGMLAVPAGEEEILARLAEWQLDTVEIAAVNAPGSLVLSGPKEALAAAAERFDDAGIATTALRVADAFHSALMEPALDGLARVLAGIELHPPTLRLVSTVTGAFDPATPGAGVADPAYWTGQVRSAVRFADACRTAAAAGASLLLEIGPDRVLTGLAARTLADRGPADTHEPVTTIATAKRGGDETGLLVAAAATAWVSGARVDWTAVNGAGERPAADIALYPFQRKRYWLDVAPLAGLAPGMEPVEHPLLHAALRLPDGGLVVTGTLGARSARWLADHVVNGRILLPGTAFVELSLVAGEQAGSPVLEELTLEAPLVLTETEPVTVEAVLSPADDTGRRSLSIHTYAESRGEWLRHAAGFVTATPAAPAAALAAWPPPGATSIQVGEAYAELTGRGYGYGPAFQGLHAAWTADGALYAEVALPEAAGPVAGYRMHPALLDIAMHADLVVDLREGGSEALLPFAWTGVQLTTPGTSTLRVAVERIRGAEESRMVVADTAGRIVLQVDRLVSRADDPRAHVDPDLHVVGWEAVTVAAAATPSPDSAVVAPGESLPAGGSGLVVLAVPTGTPVTDAGATLTGVLTVLQQHLERPSGHLAVVTREGVLVESAASPGTAAGTDADADTGATAAPATPTGSPEAPAPDVDPVAAAVWGLVRGAQAEQPGRVTLIDGADPRHTAEISAAVATGEPELAVREGNWLRARFVPAAAGSAGDWDCERTVLVTGGVSGLGAIIARHLAAQGVRHLTLTSRRGRTAGGVEQLLVELAELGATADVVACDVTDPAAVADVVDGCTPAVGGVVHCAAEVASGVITDLDRESIARALGAKAKGAWNLHRATAGLDLTRFVVISSAGATVLAEGQANYAAANAFLDGLAHHRRHRGLPASAVAFPLWNVVTGLGGDLTDADLTRMARLGLPAISAERGLELFDAALAVGAASVAALKVDAGALSRRSEVPALLRRWVRAKRATPQAAAAAGNTLAEALAGMSASAAERHVLGLVCEHVATVLGYHSAADVSADKAFRDVGFDSLAAVELRNALNAATGLRLPVTLVFDHPTPRHVTALIIGDLAVSPAAKETTAVAPVLAHGNAEEDAIAIVGMGCRFPGGVRTPEDLWALLAEGRDAMGPFPADRGWAGDIYDAEPGTPGKTYTDKGGFLYDAAEFDPVFFGIGAREAIAMDPQQRQLLEVAYETIERAGIDPASLRGSATGVWAGVMYHDYGSRLTSVPEEVAGFLGNGTAASILTGRVAYTLGLEGPAVSVDTACSSSLVALHSACQSLRAGEVSMALAGGVTVMSTPELFIEFSQQKGMAADGRCKSFAAAADGTGWSEGVGLVLLERLSDAQRLGHNVLAVIRGSAMNQDGASNGMTAPNGPSQQRVIAAALERAGLTAADVDLVEGHGTGTVLGDPIEAQALLATYGRARAEDDPVWLGSIKSNLGHAQAAAGISGVIKCVLALQHGLMPQTLHVDEPSPKIDWSEGAVALLTQAREWPQGRVRRAAVSSFGLSGTNAHVILEQAPAPAAAPTRPAGTSAPLVLGALDTAALGRQAEALRDALVADPESDLDALSRAALTTRTPQPVRAVLAATTREQLLADLGALAADPGLATESVWTTRAKSGRRCAFVFPGQGAQRTGMGSDLLAAEPVFAAAYQEIVALFDAEMRANASPGEDPVPLAEVVAAPEHRALLSRTRYTQGALFAYQVALYRLVASWGLEPELLVGHSVGEIAAAHVAGVLTLPDAVRLVAARGRLMDALPEGGRMLAVQATEAEALAAIDSAGAAGRVSVAAVNGPKAVVISGAADAVTAIAEAFDGQGRRTTPLQVSHAFHSPAMAPMLTEFRAIVESLDLAEPRLPIVANVTGRLGGGELATADYWVEHVPGTVRFADGIAAADADGIDCFLELGAVPVLATMIAASVEDPDAVLATGPRLPRPGQSGALTEAESAKLAVARLFAAGVALDRNAFAGTGPSATLPTYAFARQRYWLEDAPAPAAPAAAAGAAAGTVAAALMAVRAHVASAPPVSGHPLLSTIVPLVTGDQVIATGRLDPAGLGWLGEHAIGSTAILPGTAYIEMILRAGAEVGADTVEELIQLAPMPFGANGVDVQVVLSADGDGWTASIHSRPTGDPAAGWTEHARGRVVAAALADVPALPEPLTAWPPSGATEIPAGRLYADLADAGFGYGPAFQGVRAAWRSDDTVYAEVSLPDSEAAAAAAYGIHPALLDACMHAEQFLAEEESQALPFSWNGLRLVVPGRSAVRVVLRKPGTHTITLALHDENGRAIGGVESVTLRENSIPRLPLHEIGWHETPAPVATEVVVGLGVDLPGVPAAYEPMTGATALAWAPVPVLGDLVARTERAVTDTLALVRDWLTVADESARLVVLTRGAVCAVEGDRIDPAASAVWGVLRAATAENPGRFAVVDVDAAGPAAVVAAACGEDEVAARGERVLIPRLVALPDPAAGEPGFDPAAPVLVTGGTGLLGRLLARHLVATHGARRLIVASRRGPQAPGAAELKTELEQTGSTVDLVAADLGDPASVRAMIEALPVRPRAIVHAAGVMDNAAVGGLTPEQVRQVLAPKVAGAWALHAATRDLEIDTFVLYSSIGGLTLAAGQANYAAANTFLDGFAQWRRGQGLPATSIAWGLWAGTAGEGQDLNEADMRRMLRQGVRPLAIRDGLSLLDRALSGAPAAVVAAHYDRSALADAVWVPALLREVADGAVVLPSVAPTSAPAAPAAPGRAGKAEAAREFVQSLAGLGKRERQASAEDLVLRHTATVLGLNGPEQVLRDRGFTQMGIDSLGAVELRNRLQQATGLRLSATLIFDQPTVEDLAMHLLANLPALDPQPPATTTTATSATAAPTTHARPTEHAGATPAAVTPASGAIPAAGAIPADTTLVADTGFDDTGFDDTGFDDTGFDDMDIEQLIAAAMAE